jgi:hypothetical protein
MVLCPKCNTKLIKVVNPHSNCVHFVCDCTKNKVTENKIVDIVKPKDVFGKGVFDVK